MKTSDADKDNCFLLCRDQHHLHVLRLKARHMPGRLCTSTLLGDPSQVQEPFAQAWNSALGLPEIDAWSSPRNLGLVNGYNQLKQS